MHRPSDTFWFIAFGMAGAQGGVCLLYTCGAMPLLTEALWSLGVHSGLYCTSCESVYPECG